MGSSEEKFGLSDDEVRAKLAKLEKIELLEAELKIVDDHNMEDVRKYLEHVGQPNFKFDLSRPDESTVENVDAEEDEVFFVEASFMKPQDDIADLFASHDFSSLDMETFENLHRGVRGALRVLNLTLADAYHLRASQIKFVINDGDNGFAVYFNIDGQYRRVMSPPPRCFPEMLMHLQRHAYPGLYESILNPPAVRRGFFGRLVQPKVDQIKNVYINHEHGTFKFFDLCDCTYDILPNRTRVKCQFARSSRFEKDETIEMDFPDVVININRTAPLVVPVDLEKTLEDYADVFAWRWQSNEQDVLEKKRTGLVPGLYLITGPSNEQRRNMLVEFAFKFSGMNMNTYFVGQDDLKIDYVTHLNGDDEYWMKIKSAIDSGRADVILLDDIQTAMEVHEVCLAIAQGKVVVACLPIQKGDDWMKYFELIGPNMPQNVKSTFDEKTQLVLEVKPELCLCKKCKHPVGEADITLHRNVTRETAFVAGKGCRDCGESGFEATLFYPYVRHPNNIGLSQYNQKLFFDLVNNGVISADSEM